MRKLLAVALTLSLQVAAAGAPLVHSHPDEHATDHHDGRAVHAHWEAHRTAVPHVADGPSFDHDDGDRAVYVTTFVAVATAAFSAPGRAEQVFALAVSDERAAHRPIDDVRTHDPPASWSLSPRAPPLFLS